MLSVFWDTKGIIMTDYLPTGKSITGEYFSDLLLKLKDSLKSKRRGKLTKGVFLLQDNAPSHKSALAVGTAQSCGYEILPRPAYSPDLAPSDFFCFPNWKSNWRANVLTRKMKWYAQLKTGFKRKVGCFILKDFWRSSRDGRNVSSWVETMWRNKSILCENQISSIIFS